MIHGKRRKHTHTRIRENHERINEKQRRKQSPHLSSSWSNWRTETLIPFFLWMPLWSPRASPLLIIVRRSLSLLFRFGASAGEREAEPKIHYHSQTQTSTYLSTCHKFISLKNQIGNFHHQWLEITWAILFRTSHMISTKGVDGEWGALKMLRHDQSISQ